MNIWIIILLGGLLTFGMRFSFIYLVGKYEIPELMQRALRFVPPAVLTAIVVPELLIRSDQLDLSLMNFRLISGFVAIFVAWKTKNILMTLLVGMAVLLILEFVY
ncbi:MAG: AzlD domain-containing protein [Anaerolineae bacterium]|nr:AzlD domain-containing protein [Anaerolineae bacterium]MDK1080005.1 AzlD domain-containing protein [Anaerolineae bacterium]MDK1117232.1 AzlD domain-containing protein [Anaerolineae bacterium]